MERLNTIQKRNNLNSVYRGIEKGPGGGYHDYYICLTPYDLDNIPERHLIPIKFQKGPRSDENARQGVLDEDLLEIVRDRLKSFQEGPYATRENACAITHIEEALMWLNKRAEDRAERGVLGTMEK